MGRELIPFTLSKIREELVHQKWVKLGTSLIGWLKFLCQDGADNYAAAEYRSQGLAGDCELATVAFTTHSTL